MASGRRADYHECNPSGPNGSRPTRILHPSTGAPPVTDRPQSTRPSIPVSASESSQPSNRRDFLTSATATLAGAAAATTLASGLTVPLVHAAGTSTIKIGL